MHRVVALIALLLHITICIDAAEVSDVSASGPVDTGTRWAVLAFMSPDRVNDAFDQHGKFCNALDSALTLNIPPQNIIVLANPGFNAIKKCQGEPYNLQQALKLSKQAGTPVHVVTSGLTVPLWVDVVTGNTEALPSGVPAVPRDASFLMLYIGAHGALPNAVSDRTAGLYSLEDYLSGGMMAFYPVNEPTPIDVVVPDKSLLHATGFPPVPKFGGENRALTGKAINWVLHHLQSDDRRAHKPTVVTFITSCFGARLFNRVAQRIDKTQEQAVRPDMVPARAEKKQKLFEASPIPNTVVFTNALDYMPSSGWGFDEALTTALKADGTRTWKDVLTALKSAEVKDTPEQQTRQKREVLKQNEPEKFHRLKKPAEWRLRAFGDAAVFNKPIGDRKTYDRTLYDVYTVFHITRSSLERLGQVKLAEDWEPKSAEELVQLAEQQLPRIKDMVSGGKWELYYFDVANLRTVGKGGLGKASNDMLRNVAQYWYSVRAMYHPAFKWIWWELQKAKAFGIYTD